MVRNVALFFGLGLVWLFVFALPVGKGKSVYEVMHYYIVDTRPVHWVVGKVQGGYDAAIDPAESSGDTFSLDGKETLSQGTDMLKAVEWGTQPEP